MQIAIDFFFGSVPGLALFSLLVVLAVCLLATPFIIIAKLSELSTCLLALRDEVNNSAVEALETQATINKNMAALLLNLPRMLKDAGRDTDGVA